jgi:hypothetical protein
MMEIQDIPNIKIDPCPINCQGYYPEYETCNDRCGSSSYPVRRRYITNVTPQHGGIPCPPFMETKDCPATDPCPDLEAEAAAATAAAAERERKNRLIYRNKFTHTHDSHGGYQNGIKLSFNLKNVIDWSNYTWDAIIDNVINSYISIYMGSNTFVTVPDAFNIQHYTQAVEAVWKSGGKTARYNYQRNKSWTNYKL